MTDSYPLCGSCERFTKHAPGYGSCPIIGAAREKQPAPNHCLTPAYKPKEKEKEDD